MKLLAILLTCSLLTVVSASAQDFQPKRFDRTKVGLTATFLSLQSLDAGVTEYGFHSAKWQEHNPLVPRSTAGRMAYFAVTGAAVVEASKWAARRGHRKFSLGILIGGIAVEGYASSHSLIGVQR